MDRTLPLGGGNASAERFGRPAPDAYGFVSAYPSSFAPPK